MKGYWQRHLLNAKADEVHPEGIDKDAGGMDQDTSIALFGPTPLPAQRRHATRKEWKAHQPFVPKKHDSGRSQGPSSSSLWGFLLLCPEDALLPTSMSGSAPH
jgi:hypothetical protein